MQFIGDLRELNFGLKEVKQLFNLDLQEELQVHQLDEADEACLRIVRSNENRIEYKEKHHFFRGLSLYMQFVEEGQETFNYEERAYIPVSGAMFDVSRNSVYKVSKVKELLVRLAMMGHSTCMLYSEDTYTIPEYPYFGYMRGRYSEEEIKEIDEYAYQLGIELIPCIQTLAHMKQTLKWNYANKFKDTADVLLVGAPETYEFLDHMLKSLRSTFRTNRIHIGMDEAWDLGRGRSLDVNGHKHHLELMSMHLEGVCKLLDKYGFEPMMWDDMFLRAAAPDSDHYDLNIQVDQKVIDSVPHNMSMVYWDYYHTEVDFYNKAIEIRKNFKKPIIFAGGVWKWVGYAPNYERTFLTTDLALTTCKREGIEEAFATLWGDDGDEAPIDCALLGLIYFAEHCFLDKVDMEWVNRRCKYLTGLSVDDFRSPEELNLIPGVPSPNLESFNPSKQFLYQDILLGAFDFYVKDFGLDEHYLALAEKYSAIANKSNTYKSMFNVYATLSKVLATKATVGVRIRQAYLAQDKKVLEVIAKEMLPSLINNLYDFSNTLRTLWYEDCKGQGYEILDVRLAGIVSRCKTAIWRIEQYLVGQVNVLEELEEERLPFKMTWHNGEDIISHDQYATTYSQNVVSHLL